MFILHLLGCKDNNFIMTANQEQYFLFCNLCTGLNCEIRSRTLKTKIEYDKE